jgi:hypothetical protein
MTTQRPFGVAFTLVRDTSSNDPNSQLLRTPTLST